MKYLSKARQVCIHPPILKETIKHVERMLFIKEKDKQSKLEEPAIDIAELYVSESKINTLLKTLLERKDNGCGKIVFCHYYAEIDIIEKRLNEKAKEKEGEKQIKIGKFDGRVPQSQRDILLSEPFDVLLAQIKMCREGLNMQDNYSEVYFPSPDFNPAMEDQAIARCWRIGQTKEVHVFKYTMRAGTPPATQAPPPASKASPWTPALFDEQNNTFYQRSKYKKG
jgi:SNF2 family DNA or RNA helicase